MKPRLSRILLTALLAAQCSTMAYAVVQPDGIDHTLTENTALSTETDKVYDVNVTIGGDVICSNVGGVYVSGVEVMDRTKVNNVTVNMDDGSITDILAAGNLRAQAIDGTVEFNISGGFVNSLYGGNWLTTDLSYDYTANIDSITINVSGDTLMNKIIGGSLVSIEGGHPMTDDFIRNYTTSGSITINLSENSYGGEIYGIASSHHVVNGSLSVNIDGTESIDRIQAQSIEGVRGGTVNGDVTIDATNCSTRGWICGVYSGDVKQTTDESGASTGGNVSVIVYEDEAKSSIIDEIHGVLWGGNVEGNVSVEVTNVDENRFIGGIKYGTVEGDISVKTENNTVSNCIYGVASLYDGAYGVAKGNVSVSNKGGNVSNIYGVTGGIAYGNVSVKTEDGTNGSVHGLAGGEVYGNVEVSTKNSDIAGGMVCGVYYGTVGKASNAAGELVGGNVTVTAYADEEFRTKIDEVHGLLWGGSVAGDVTVSATNIGQSRFVGGVKYGTVEGNIKIEAENCNITNYLYGVGVLYDGAYGIAKGDVSISNKGGEVANIYGINQAVAYGNVTVTTESGSVNEVYGICIGQVDKNVYVTTNGGSVGTACGNWDGNVTGDVVVTTNGGTVNDVTGALGGYIGGDVVVTTNGGTLGSCTGVLGSQVAGNAYFTINDGESQNIFGVYRGVVEGDATIVMNGGQVNDIIGVASDVYGTGTVKGDLSVYLLGGKVNGDVWGTHDEALAGSSVLYIGSEDTPYIGTVNEIKYFDRIVVASGSSITTTKGNIFNSTHHDFKICSANIDTAIVSTSGSVAIDKAITLNLYVPSTLKSGRYMIIDASKGEVDTTNWTADMVNITSEDTSSVTYARARNTADESIVVSFDDLKWEDNILYLYQVKDDIKSPVASNWGAFKSSQAFVSALKGNRNNRVVMTNSYDAKGGLATHPRDYSIAWGSAYGQNARIGGIGADYNIYGGAIGAEHHFVSGCSIGIAAGYDWGKVSPFNQAAIDQESAHLALYGRAASWKLNQKDSVVIDWSAALNNTTSETDCVDSDWEQKNIQLDARVSYMHTLNDKATGYVFGGVQYYAAEDATADYIHVSSMQNLRTEIGTGIDYKLNSKTTLRTEASLYNDAMRHNPYVSANGVSYGGTNPGRLGGSISAGASYQLNDKWNIYGNYSFDVADDSTEHNVNVGASVQF